MHHLEEEKKSFEAEKVTLNNKIEELTIELEDAKEKVFRMDSITSMLTQSRKRVEKLQEELKTKETEISELNRQITQLDEQLIDAQMAQSSGISTTRKRGPWYFYLKIFYN